MAMAVFAAMVPAALAADVVEPVGPTGSVDWTNGTVTATGVGAPPANATSANHAKEMAKRAAFLMANRNLLEAVKGIRVDSISLVENYVLTSDVIKTEVSGFVHGATVTNTRFNPDGSVEVTISRKLDGDFMDMMRPPDQKGRKEKMSRKPVSTAPVPAAYTGVILDARGTGLQPAVVARIKDEQGREVYGPAVVGTEAAAEHGRLMGYVKDEAAAQANSWAGGRPLTIKAVRSEGERRADAVVAAGDAQSLSDPALADLLEQGRVVAIID
jgi:hypothetical protein